MKEKKYWPLKKNRCSEGFLENPKRWRWRAENFVREDVFFFDFGQDLAELWCVETWGLVMSVLRCGVLFCCCLLWFVFFLSLRVPRESNGGATMHM